MKVVSKSNSLTIKFFNLDGSLFAQSPIPRRFEDAVQKCVDSSRGFAIRLQNSNGKFAWVGLAFRDRNDAFDFNVCFKDFEEKVDAEKNPEPHACPVHEHGESDDEQGDRALGEDGEPDGESGKGIPDNPPPGPGHENRFGGQIQRGVFGGHGQLRHRQQQQQRVQQ